MGTVGNPNPVQTDEFKAKRAETQFGGPRENPRDQDNPGPRRTWTMRKALEHLTGVEIDPTKDIDKELERILKYSHPPDKKPTMGFMLMFRYYEKAIKTAPITLFDKIIEQTEGKLEVAPEPPPPPAAFKTDNITDEEADAAYEAACKGQ